MASAPAAAESKLVACADTPNPAPNARVQPAQNLQHNMRQAARIQESIASGMVLYITKLTPPPPGPLLHKNRGGEGASAPARGGLLPSPRDEGAGRGDTDRIFIGNYSLDTGH